MTRAADLRRDYNALGRKLVDADGSEAAAIVRERRLLSDGVARIDRAADLRADYEALGRKLKHADGAGAAALVRERRLIAAELEVIELPQETPLVDKLAAKRTGAGRARPPARRRKSG